MVGFQFACWVISHAFVVIWLFFKINFFKKILSGTLSEYQTIWTQIRTDILSVLIWDQTVCKGLVHRKGKKDSARKERVKFFEYFENLQYLCVFTYLYIIKVIGRQQKTALAKKELIFCVNILRIYNIHVYLRIGTVWNGPYSLLTRHPPLVQTTSLTL